jgi:glutamate-1-semialdehyde 2,1-aminomutase
MACLAPLGPVYQAGTLSGNPLATAAGLAALGELDDDLFALLSSRAARLGAGMAKAIGGAGIPVTVPVVGPLYGLHFNATPAVDYDSARTTDTARYAAFFHAMLRRGVAMAPGPYEVAFPGLAHDDAVIDVVLDAAHDAALEVASSADRTVAAT